MHLHYHSTLDPKSNLEPRMKRWILRILVSLNGHRDFIGDQYIRNDKLGIAMGLEHWIDSPLAKFNKGAVIRELKALQLIAEKENGDEKAQGFLHKNIERLSTLIGLSPVDCQILEFAILLRHDAILNDAIDFLGSLTSSDVFFSLAIILNLPVNQISAALSAKALLAQSGILSLVSGSLHMNTKLDLLSASFADLMISAETEPFELLRGTVSTASPCTLCIDDYAHINTSLKVLQPYLRIALESTKPGVNIFIYGAPGTGKSQLAKVIANDFACELLEVAREDDDGNPIDGLQRLRAFSAAQTIFAKRRILIAFDEVEDIFNDGNHFWGRKSTAQTRKGWINHTLEENSVPTLWLSNSIDGIDPAFLRRFDMLIEVPVPPKKQRHKIIHSSCHDLIDAESIARIAKIETLSPAIITKAASVVRSIRDEFDTQDRAKVFEQLISNTLTAQGHKGLHQHKSNQLPAFYNTAFICANTDLTNVAEGLKHSSSARICLYGPPGTGKTAYGYWLAEQLEVPLHVKRASDLMSPYVGENERNIARAFRSAQAEGAILLIDEVDGFLQDRQYAKQNWEITLVNEMLTQMESFAGIFIASTNLMSGLDHASLRRFDLKVQFDYLQPEQVIALYYQYCEQLGFTHMKPSDEQALRHLNNLTPGDFSVAMRQHRFNPIITAQQLLEILKAESAIKGGTSQKIGFIH